MNQVNQVKNYDAPPNMPMKRKRGRPRKDHTLNRREAPPLPPGFGVFNGNHPRQVDAIEVSNESIVGQSVTGVVEEAFDAGYLLAVKIGNSNTSLRGVVFKPGHFVPISTENDVAPHVQMIRRNVFPMENQNQSRVPGHRPRSRERKEKHGKLRRIETGNLLNGSPTANQVHTHDPQIADLAASKGKHVLPVSAYATPSMGSRGTMVPVVLQPVSVSNGLPPVNQVPSVPSQAGHMADSKHKPVQTVTTQVPYLQPQTSQNGEEVKAMNPTGVSQSSETRIENSMAVGKSSVEDSGLSGEADSDETLFVEPIRTIHSCVRNQSGPVPISLENHRIGRMSELLQECRGTEFKERLEYKTLFC
ncbi:hypothetical protein CsSME_00018277 [Camellia sinensis var. sinensis]